MPNNPRGLLPDVPLLLDRDAEGSKDTLDRNGYATALAQAAVHTPQTITIGVYGDWGSGKTSAMRLMQRIIDEGDQALTVWFNAWQYERVDHIIVPLLSTIVNDIEYAKNKQRGPYEKAAEAVKKKLTALVEPLRAVARATSLEFGVPGSPKVSIDFGKAISEGEKLAEGRAKDTAPPGGRYFDAFRTLRHLSGQPDVPRIVIFIDDLDRCTAAKAFELLENIKLVLDLPNFSYVIGLAEGIIESFVRAKFKDESPDNQEMRKRFLHKFIQVPMQLPHPVLSDMERYIKSLIANNSVFTQDEQTRLAQLMPILVTIAQGNPRNVVRFINPLIVLKRISEASAATDVPLADLAFASALGKVRDALCKWTIVFPKTSEEGSQPKGERENLYRSFNWEDIPDEVPFRRGLQLLFDNADYFDPADPLAKKFPERLEALAGVQTHPGVSQALLRLQQNLPLCSALKSDSGFAWLDSEDRVQASFELTRSIAVKDGQPTARGGDKESEPDEVDWATIETQVHRRGADPLSFKPILDQIERTGRPPEFARGYIRDLAPLAGFNALRRLHLAGCRGVSDLAPLAGLTALRELDLQGCTGVSDLTPLAGLTTLELLYFHGCSDVIDLAPLTRLTALRQLYLQGCTGVSDLTPLAGLTALWRLDLQGCTGVSVLVPLAGLTALRWIDLQGCTGASDLAPLAGLPKLEGVALKGSGFDRDSVPDSLWEKCYWDI